MRTCSRRSDYDQMTMRESTNDFSMKLFLNALLGFLICNLDKQVLCIYAEISHLESNKSTE